MVRSAEIYREVMGVFVGRPCQFFKKNLVVEFMEQGLLLASSLNSVDKCRCQPTFNRAISSQWIRSTLKVMVEAIDMSKKESRPSFPKMLKHFMSVRHFGKLIAQHLIHTMALVGLLPAVYSTLAAVSETTKTAKRLSEHGIMPSSFHVLLDKLHAKLQMSHDKCESAVCKEGKDSAESNQYCDVIYHDQDIIRYAVWDESRQRYLIRTIFRKHSLRPIDSELWRPSSIRNETNKSMAYNFEEAVDRWWAPCSDKVLKLLEEHFIPVTNKKKENDFEKDPGTRKRSPASFAPDPLATGFGMDEVVMCEQPSGKRQRMMRMDHRQQYLKLFRTEDFKQARSEEKEMIQYMKGCAKDDSYVRYNETMGSRDLR